MGLFLRFFRRYLLTHGYRQRDRVELPPLLATGSVGPVISLPSMQPRSSVANPRPPSSTGLSQLSFGAVSDPSLVVEIEEEMDASCFKFHSTFSEAGVSQDVFTADPSTPPDLQ